MVKCLTIAWVLALLLFITVVIDSAYSVLRVHEDVATAFVVACIASLWLGILFMLPVLFMFARLSKDLLRIIFDNDELTERLRRQNEEKQQ